ncbi:hypothetical protein PVAND_000827 [Polypedilum vanderplanki]|uniref:Ionotropic glutamate receptor C-terminal domain-containing protein n=1 Tax=Polypedilum vanderplanki TaxID=319348 RepID=A0A9J6BMF0_POLVA|nr:hypothetical protein PVAND_000827 [Polypedilum vanderplanki]
MKHKNSKFFFLTALFILSKFVGEVIGAIKPIDYEIDSTMAPCVLSLCSKYFKSERALKGSLVIINLVPTPSVVQARILRRFNEDNSHLLAVMVKDSKKPHRSSRVQEKAQNYFMLLQHFDDFDATLWQLKKLPTWNPLAQIVVQFTVPFKNQTIQEEWTEKLFTELHSHDALKVNIMYQFSNETTKIRVDSWFPYHNESCPTEVNNIKKIEECVVHIKTDENGKISRSPEMTSFNQDLYPKIPTKLHNCPLNVSTIIWEPFVVASDDDFDDDDDPVVDKGLEVLMLKTITEGMQLKMLFHTVNRERAVRTITNNNRTGLYAKLLTKKADVMIGGLYETQISRQLLSASIPYYQDDITWCVAPAGLAPKWLNVFIIFNFTTWIGLILTILITSIFLYYFVKYEGKYHENYTWSFLIMFSLSTSQYAHYNPIKSGIKIFLASFFFFGLHISTAYHSYLINVLTNPRYTKQIDSVDEAITFGMKFKAAENARDFFMKNDSSTQYLLREYIVCKKLDDCFLELTKDKKLAVAISRSHALNNPLQLKDGIDFFCFPVEDNVVIYSAVMLFRKFYHLLPMIDDRIRTILESGLLSKWELDSVKIAKKKDSSDSSSGGHGNGPQIKLALEHVEGAFLLIIIGLIVALIVFIIELLVSYMIKKKMFEKYLKKMEQVLCYA